MDIVKEIFKVLISLYSEQTELTNNTLQTSLSNFSSIKYIKKIIPSNLIISKENNQENNNIQNLKKNVIKKTNFDVEKQKKILLKRRKEKPFERYKHCKDLIDYLRIKLIKYILNKKREKKTNLKFAN